MLGSFSPGEVIMVRCEPSQGLFQAAEKWLELEIPSWCREWAWVCTVGAAAWHPPWKFLPEKATT